MPVRHTDFYQDKKVLVTGGTGFVGSYVVASLVAQGAMVRVPIHRRPLRFTSTQIELVEADLLNPVDCQRVCQGVQYVVHAAGPVCGVGVAKGQNQYFENMRVNLILLIQCLQAAWNQGVERFLLFSSSTGYPAVEHAVTEAEFWVGEVPAPYLGYGWMRRYFEKLAEFVAENSPMQLAIVRPTAIYGRWDDFDPVTSHVIPALIRRAFAREAPFHIWGTGQEVRDFLHVSDLVYGAMLLLEKCPADAPVNIGYGVDVTIAEIARLILDYAGYGHAKVVFENSRPTAIPCRRVNIDKARQLLGFEPRITLSEGLKDVCQWYQQEYLKSAVSHL